MFQMNRIQPDETCGVIIWKKLTVNNQTLLGRSDALKTTYDPYVGLLMLELNSGIEHKYSTEKEVRKCEFYL